MARGGLARANKTAGTSLREFTERRWHAWTCDPFGAVRFVYDLGGRLEPPQVEILTAVAGFPYGTGLYGVAIRSAKGIGKTYALAWLALWFLATKFESTVLCTAPKEDQIWDHLWAEMERVIRGSSWMESYLDFNATRIGVKGGPDIWQAVGRVGRHKESIQGFHADDMMYVVDEASGVDDDVIDTLIDGMSHERNLTVMSANPWRNTGAFYRAFNKDRRHWLQKHYTAYDSKRVSPSTIERAIRARGKSDPKVLVTIFGEFPKQAQDALFSMGWFYDAQARAPQIMEGRVVYGLDVARYGNDSSAMARRRGWHYDYLERWHGLNTMETARTMAEKLEEHEPDEDVTVNVDVIGVGAGVVDRLWEMQEAGKISDSVTINPVNVAESPQDDDKYATLRDELWIDFGDRMRDGHVSFDRDIDGDLFEAMVGDALPAKKRFLGRGAKSKVNSKDEMKKLTPDGNSPDMMDAVLLASYESTTGVVHV